MGIQDIIEGKKQWRAHLARVKALPPDYQIVYTEIQKYYFKVGPINLARRAPAHGDPRLLRRGAPRPARGSRELVGDDVAAFADDLIKDSRTYAEIYQDSSRT